MGETQQVQEYDVVVVGGGAAGLGGAMVLGRSRRSVLVVDAGSPRNAPARQVHNYLGREGTPPLELLEIGRTEVAQYGVQVTFGRVEAVRRWDRAGTGFVVTTEAGREVVARRVLVASGVSDVLPDVPGVAERWGRDVLHCPYCHGWEVRDRAIVVVGSNTLVAHQALMFRNLSADVVVVLTEQAPRPGEEDLARLGAWGIRVVEDAPTEVVVEDDVLTGLRLASGDVLACDAVVVSVGFRANADFLAPVGVRPVPFEMNGETFGTIVEADPTGATAVPGLWVAGNVGDAMTQVVNAASAGLRAGAVVNYDLIEEDTRIALHDQQSHGRDFFEQPAWEERYGAGDAIWSGRVNPQLESEAAGMLPARVLDIGSGEGADSIWLASRGWSVTGLDFSTVALERAAAHATAAGVGDRTEWRHLDVRTLDPTAFDERWDLVTSQFMHLPDGGMVDLTRRLAAAVAPGGTLLVVGHHPDDVHTGLRHGEPSFMFTPQDLTPALDPEAWEIEVAEVRSRTAEGPDGEPVTVRDSVLRARRRS